MMITRQETAFYQKQEVVLLRGTNSSGAFFEVTNYGATIRAIVVPDKSENLDNVVLHYGKLMDYFSDSFYMGATIGRYANRISNARFSLDGKTYNLEKNDGRNSNHGGYSGFNKQVFKYEIDDDRIIFILESQDGDGGFPGNLKLHVIYSFSEDNELKIEYKIYATEKTVVNITNHSYFNLSAKYNTILDHYLLIRSQKFLETNDEFLPTGNILSIKGTVNDFSENKSICQMMSNKNDRMKGYNAFFIRNCDSETALVSLWDKSSGRIVDLYTSMPGVQIYTGDFLSHPFMPYGGICLEAQYHPDGVNNPNFETCLLSPYVEKTEVIRYRFRYCLW